MNWASRKCLFEHHALNSGGITTVKFRQDGKGLVCRSARGEVTAWNTGDWTPVSTVNMTGALTHIAFYPDVKSVALASSRDDTPKGEIRHWTMKKGKLAPYNVASVYCINGLSFREGTNDIAMGSDIGQVQVWDCPESNPSLDFEGVRKNMLLDFTLSADGTLAASSTRDAMIHLWNTETGARVASYSSVDCGCQQVVLNADGTRIASSSPNNKIRIWNPEQPPSDSDICFELEDKNIGCLSFCPDGSKILICCDDEVQIWSLETLEKTGQVPNSGTLDASFSADGKFIVVGTTNRSLIWDVTTREKVFDTGESASQTISFAITKNVIQTCGPLAHRMWQTSLRTARVMSLPQEWGTESTVDSIFSFVDHYIPPRIMMYSGSTLLLKTWGVLAIFKLHK